MGMSSEKTQASPGSAKGRKELPLQDFAVERDWYWHPLPPLVPEMDRRRSDVVANAHMLED